MAKMTPTVQGNRLVYQQDEHEQVLVVGTLSWYAWLETASAFAFQSDAGTFTARKERAGNKRGGWYWKAYRTHHGKLSSLYLGKSETLSLERLNAVARALGDVSVAAGNAGAQKETGSPATHPPHDPLLATKLPVPHLRAQLVRRARLVERLQQGMERTLTLVSGPAGFGKTTLLAQWLAEGSTPVAWLSLAPEDNDPTRFLSSVLAALQTVDAQLGAPALTLLQTPQPPPPETVLAALMHDRMSREAVELVLVLDDYHVITADPVHRAMRYLVEHLPPQLHLVLSTRADPPLPLARLRARGQLTELRAAELRFVSSEVNDFLQTVMGLNLPAEAVAALERRTEGWIAGLQLAALSLQGRTDVEAFLAAFTGSHRFVLDYLSEEVLSQLPEPVLSFLFHTSILDRLCAPLCDAVTGQEGSQAILELLEQANLFVVPLDDERRWYRYHHLFADVLQSRLHQTAPALVPELHRRASAWFEEQGLATEAVQHALAAPDVERAARLIEQVGRPSIVRGQVKTV